MTARTCSPALNLSGPLSAAWMVMQATGEISVASASRTTSEGCDQVAPRSLERRMAALLGGSEGTVEERYRSYVQAAADGQNMRAEWALWFHSSCRAELQEAWSRHLDRWLLIPEGTPPARRARLLTARLAADGLWAAQASGVGAPGKADAAAIVAHILGLIGEGGAE